MWRALGLMLGSTGGLAALVGLRPLAFDFLLRLLSTFLSATSAAQPALVSSWPSPRRSGAALVAWLWTTGGVVAVALGARLWAQRSRRYVDVVATRPQPTCGGGGDDAMTFSRLVHEEGHREPKLIGRAQLRHLFFLELDQQQWTFQRVKELCEPWLFAHPSLIEPEELAGLFGRELERLHLCELIDLYWDWPLSEFVGRLVPDAELAAQLCHLQYRYAVASKLWANSCRAVHDDFAQQKQLADDICRVKAHAAERVHSAASAKHAAKLERIAAAQQGLVGAQLDDDEKWASEWRRLQASEGRARQQLVTADERKASAVEDATTELRLRVLVLELDRDQRLRSVSELLADEKAHLDREWRKHHAAALLPSAPPLEV
ncbi:uncharacterized protein ACA1_106020 [Acanthamoeba castellanii str. Neff]|uniref:Uncharacterized protein n=1 Tax=Acanthamoeba castellanii (strain ATCC 30010 / Neff) TaxID=1257118 RepID=L8GQ74_ACACF|nr:uncharacterized protein ACA1_106020 [Acanthamoeba castellanii str. Neff]ELR14281.1 hypothetical protein ACA1_106020 [Acanthamoeba castellanii str. Neff]